MVRRSLSDPVWEELQGYDSDKIRAQVRKQGMVPVIPRKFNSKKLILVMIRVFIKKDIS